MANILKFLKKIFFNKEKFVMAFCENNGLSNLLIVMIENINKDDVKKQFIYKSYCNLNFI